MFAAPMFAATVLAATVLASTAARADDALASAPIDYSIYRPGEVKRVEQQFAAWQLTCDEIKRLSHKFCSLRGVARASDGTIVAALTVSTDDRGRPAAIVRLPFGTALSDGLVLRRADFSARRRPMVMVLQPSLCDRQGCEVVWPLVPEDIRTLTSNEPVAIAFHMATPPPALSPLQAAFVPVQGTIQTAGFAAALQASMTR